MMKYTVSEYIPVVCAVCGVKIDPGSLVYKHGDWKGHEPHEWQCLAHVDVLVSSPPSSSVGAGTGGGETQEIAARIVKEFEYSLSPLRLTNLARSITSALTEKDEALTALKAEKENDAWHRGWKVAVKERDEARDALLKAEAQLQAQDEARAKLKHAVDPTWMDASEEHYVLLATRTRLKCEAQDEAIATLRAERDAARQGLFSHLTCEHALAEPTYAQLVAKVAALESQGEGVRGTGHSESLVRSALESLPSAAANALRAGWQQMAAAAFAEGPMPGDEAGHAGRWTAVEMCADELGRLQGQPDAARESPDTLRDRIAAALMQTYGYYTDPASSWTKGQREVAIAIVTDLRAELELPDAAREARRAGQPDD